MATAGRASPGITQPRCTLTRWPADRSLKEGTRMDAHADRLFPDLEMDADDELSLTCPACGADLVHDLLFLEYRVCSLCDRHFAMPARERVELLVDEGTYRDLHEAPAIEELDNDQVSALAGLELAKWPPGGAGEGFGSGLHLGSSLGNWHRL